MTAKTPNNVKQKIEFATQDEIGLSSAVEAVRIYLVVTSSSAIAERPRCVGGVSFGKNISAKIVHLIIALTYSGDVDESPFYCFLSPYLYLMQNFATFRR